MTAKQVIAFWLMAIVAGVSLMAAAKCFGFSSVKVSQTEKEFSGGTQIVNTTNNDVTPINQQYSNRRPVENRSGDDWVIASCQSRDEHAISGLGSLMMKMVEVGYCRMPE